MTESILRPIRLALRGGSLLLALIWGVLATLLLLLLRPFGTRARDRVLQPFARHWFRLVQRVLGVRQHLSGRPAPAPALLAANHVSWLDIIVLGSHIGTCFVSKSEVARWPVVGFLARQGGTLFIHRGRHDSAARIAHDITRRLAQGNRVVFFPEGTTSDGSSVRRFRNRLFQPAVAIGVPVQPVALRYRKDDEKTDPVAYLPGVTLMASVFGVMARRRTEVDLHWCEVLPTTGRERREIAATAEAEVAQALAAQE